MNEADNAKQSRNARSPDDAGDSIVSHNDLWIGLFFATVSERASNRFGGARLAAVNAIGPAANREAFISIVDAKLADLGLLVDDVEGVELLETRLRRFQLRDYALDESLSRLIEPARISRQVQFGTFHVTNDDAN